jgi:hypothetical protein
MKVKITEKCYTGTQGNMFAGEEHDLDDKIAEKLIARGYAEAVAAPKKAKKKFNLSNRAVDEADVATPEDD